MSGPLVSVVMPVHNAAPFLDEALNSIIGQSFSDFEFVIRDDGSTDGSIEILRSWALRDSRIRLFEGSRLGPAGSSNWIVNASAAPLIARMDADDIAFSDRLRRQVEVLLGSPDVVLLGTMSDTIDCRGRSMRRYDFSRLAKCSYSAPFPHASIMFRRDAFERIGGYRSACDHWEDLDLYLRMTEQGRIGVLAETLLAYRVHASTRLTAERDDVEGCLDRRYRCIAAHRQDGNYESLIALPIAVGVKCHPRAFVALGSMELWAGGAPDVLGRLIRRGDLKWDSATLLAIVWAVWARVSPASLRSLLAGLLWIRSRAGKRHVEHGRVYEWNPRPAERAARGRRAGRKQGSMPPVRHAEFG